MSSPSPSGPWWSRLALSPRAAVVLAAVVVVVAVVVVLVGALVSGGGEGTGGTGGVVVRGAPTASAGGASAAPSPSAGASAGAAPSAPGAGHVVVHVLGAVRRSGVVELPAASRVGDAVRRAGGATDDADLDRLNLARVLTDGERLYVPRVGQQEVPEALGPVTGGGTAGSAGDTDAATGAGETGAEGSVVDLNTADQAALETLPGIGPGLAGRIIAWRDEHGRFGSVEDLLDVSGIGDVRFAELRDRVRV
ncbi:MULTISPECIES: ComEA family DNA-binding protein [Curtobacterium]|uniref:ComEA family DNA-binding protein n=1 Tax=Curtobacterium TaxID=2034 RepID=UPI0009EB63C5|nr:MULTISPECIES: ComEA family DNA-binding protein [Curtobacterium]MBF4597793.1 ComEA family DNA-binding protein [Curtobacterium sp. VKM Ac-1796]MBF4612025.1 ComEA family DNA-binding protein [Curtobacterium sp. VKM Ac-2889]MCU0114731.1 ComEA family DNA-binding protein [Curtobacterium flaccumfaciens]